MEKVLVILPENNKGKYIAKGYASAFKDFSYFVYEKKIYDLKLDEIRKISPDIIFIYWAEMKDNHDFVDILSKYDIEKTIFVSCAQDCKDIPILKLNNKLYNFTPNEKHKTHKLLLGITPSDYKVKYQGYKYSITFAGNPALIEREKILSSLICNFGPINIFCRSFDFYKSVDEIYKNKLLDDYHIELYRSSYMGYVEKQSELAKIFVSSKINIDMNNINFHSLNYRFFEILSSGGFLLSPKNDLKLLHFEDGKDFESYSNIDDLIDKIDFYLKNLNLAQAIATNGRKNVASNHSFYDRLKVLLKVIYGKDFSNR